MLTVRIVRKPASLLFKLDAKAPDSWANNRANNSIDDFFLLDDGLVIYACKVQTVANLPGSRYLDTVAPGKFGLRAFVEQRDFYGRIHGIVNAYDLEGQLVDARSIQPFPVYDPAIGEFGDVAVIAPKSDDRWLMHDWQSKRPKPPMTLTSLAWSAGCFIVRPPALEAVSVYFDSRGVKKGDVVEGVLEMAA